jgi:hypothetical protein
MSFFDDLFGFVGDIVEGIGGIVVDVVETAGSVVVDTVEFAGDVAGDIFDVAIDATESSFNMVTHVAGIVADDTFNTTGELVTGLLGVIFGSNSSSEEREAAERQYERQMSQLRQQSDNRVAQYKQQQQQVYQQQSTLAQRGYHQQQKALFAKVKAQLKQEKSVVQGYISQLKPRKEALKAQLVHCTFTQQHTVLKQEIKAINQLLTPLYAQLKHIKKQQAELRLTQS